MLFGCSSCSLKKADRPPNIILVMADDLGYGDVGYNGNTIVKTPVLDSMAAHSIRFDRFYSAAPVCSPTRVSCLTGRHPYRMNLTWASDGILRKEEYTIAEALKTAGYATGHFGKWHVGDLTQTLKEGYAPGEINSDNYSPPWENGFDESYTVYSSMPLYNPYYLPCDPNGSDSCMMVMDKPVSLGQRTGGRVWNMRVWTGAGKFVDEWLAGTFDEMVMDKALDFIKRKSEDKKPFLSVIWLTTPHTPVIAAEKYRNLYPNLSIRQQHWFGALSAMDEQIGRLRNDLKKMGIAENTVLWFCSDNGPSWVHELNSTGGLKGKKGSLGEGGVRVPAILEYPAKFKEHKVIDIPVSTSDFFPTLLTWAGVEVPDEYPLDGIDVSGIISGELSKRPKPIGFQSPILQTDSKDAEAWLKYSGRAMVWLDNNYKLISDDKGEKWALYDLKKDKAEVKNVAPIYPDLVKRMKKELFKWTASCSASAAGADYKQIGLYSNTQSSNK